jgi:8-oxo-dGTP diphosphatase
MPPEPIEFKKLLARNLRKARAAAELSQAQVSKRMQKLGFSWVGSTVSLAMRAERRITVDELVALSLILGTTPGQLLLPEDDNGHQLVQLPGGFAFPGRRLYFRNASVAWKDDEPVLAASPEEGESDTAALAAQGAEKLLRQMRERLLEEGWTPPGAAVPSPAAQPVVAAIVTSRPGILVGHRHDDKPPWTFIAGEVEPGERPEDAAIREVKEEAGLRIATGEVIGERTHPKTGRKMIYIAAWPTHGTEVFVGDEEELAEVRWAGLAEADQLLPGMYEPVREYLSRELGEA